MQKIYIVKYKETDEILGYVENKTAYKNWLKNNNRQRKQDGEVTENASEFELIVTTLLQ